MDGELFLNDVSLEIDLGVLKLIRDVGEVIDKYMVRVDLFLWKLFFR